MNEKLLKNLIDIFRRERGVVLIAVLMFMALILPVTLLILDSVRIESLLPVNEAFTKTAGDEADKGFHDALAAIMADQDSYMVDISRDLSDTTQSYWTNTYANSQSGKHEFDYLSEIWARHPDNDTLFMVERSLENITHAENPDAGPDPDEHSVPARWQMMNVPFGMDDFGEFYNDTGDFPKILLPFEYVGEDPQPLDEQKAPAFYIDPSETSMLNLQHDGISPANFSSNDLVTFWQLSPADPNFYENLTTLDPITQFIPRPGSYFRNTSGEPWFSGNAQGLPANENNISPGFIRESNNQVDRFVYDGYFDYDGSIYPDNPFVNQYPLYLPLQQACIESRWANEYFGTTGGSGNLTAALFASTNLEYKPAPGTITRYQLGTDEENAVPGWHMAIVSDESGRFPINSLLNIIYASHNVDYEDEPTEPWVRRNQYDENLQAIDDNLIDPTSTHPNRGGFLLARDILISLMMDDGDMARLADSFDQNLYNTYKEKATWLLRQMLVRRIQLDESSDFNRNGDFDDDDSAGEIFQFPEMTGNNNSDTLDIAPPDEDTLDGSGRMGDGVDFWDGTWRVFTNPKEMMGNFTGEDNPPFGSRFLTTRDFTTLNQRVTVFSMDTEHTADPQHITPPPAQGAPPEPDDNMDVRYNIQRMQVSDDLSTSLEDESALYRILLPLVGRNRVLSIINWRDGLVDLNGDGDLLDEYIEQPVSDERYDPDNNEHGAATEWPVSTLTYRERNHPNFQDPLLAPHLIDPDYLNIQSLGDMITIPMSNSEGLIAFSEADNVNDTPKLTILTENGQLIDGQVRQLNSHSVYPDFSNGGSEIAYDDGDEVILNNLVLDNPVSVQNNRLHPSWGPGDAVMAYYNGDDIRIHDMLTDADLPVLNNAGMPPDINDTSTDLSFFWNGWPDNMVGQAIFEMGSPDISPNTGNNEIAFTRMASTGDEFMNPDDAFNIVSVKLDGSMVDTLTDNPDGVFDYSPDFSPNGNWIVFTRTSYDYMDYIPGLAGQIDDIPITTIMGMRRDGSSDLELIAPWDYDIRIVPPNGDPEFDLFDPEDDFIRFRWDPINFPTMAVEMHQPMFPNFSDDGQSVCFMDIEIIFEFNWTDPIPRPITITDVEVNVYKMDAADSGTFLSPQMWSSVIPVAANSNLLEIFPDWGSGNVRLIQQADNQSGTGGGTAIDLTDAQTATTDVQPWDVHFSESERQAIARSIGEASCALRRDPEFDITNPFRDQNWLLKDLPAVPEHMVDVLELIADVVCFREPYVTYDPDYSLTPNLSGDIDIPPLQAYPGRININTASRPVLRSLFLMMFQGPQENDPDDDAESNGPQPRIREGVGYRYVNLCDPALTDDEVRFTAMMVADRYAHQVTEYRKWVYNNQGNLGITDETVPSSLPLYTEAYAGLDPPASPAAGMNFRANPFYPLVDTNDDGEAPEIDRISPDPPFRSTADLFHIMLYDNDAFSEDWTYEGIGGNGGPNEFDLPECMLNGAEVGTLDALEIWGPIYNASDERICSHPDGAGMGGGKMYGFVAEVDNDFDDLTGNYNNFYEHQAFRLFSADDFRRIAPWLTTRTYNYRIESRGVIRIAGGTGRTDIVRDKIWIITTNTDANFGAMINQDPDWDFVVTAPLNASFRAQNRSLNEYHILFFEETPQSGLALTRETFLPD